MHSTDLRAWRKAGGFTRKQLAARLGISWFTICEWEHGRHRIPVAVALVLAHHAALDKDAARKRKYRALERARKKSLEVAPPVEKKFW